MKRLKRLWRLRHVVAIPPGAPRLNCLAAVICLMALGILFLTFHAKPAGAGLEASARSMPRLPMMTSVPLPTDDGGQRALALLPPEELNRRIHSEIHGSRLALQLHVALLEVGKHRIERFPDYTATFIKQERVNGGDVQDLQSIELKLRHKPFSVYMKWQEGGDVGRELLFAEGQYDDKMQVRLGGIKRKLPLLKLDPSGSTALREARHPVTEMGLLQLTEQILRYRRRDLGLKEGVRWEMLPDQRFMDRPCDCWVVEYANSEVSPTYRKSFTYIDRELSLPVCVRNFGWLEKDVELTEELTLDDATLIEYYGYTDIKLDNRLPDIAFDKTNADYQFRR